MSLYYVQKLLYQLNRDPLVRKRFDLDRAALLDEYELTTEELFDVISRNLSGRGSLVTLPAPVVQATLNLPLNEKVTGLPRVGVPYFFLKQTYDTARADALLAPRGVRCPRFPDYVQALIDFVERHPKI